MKEKMLYNWNSLFELQKYLIEADLKPSVENGRHANSDPNGVQAGDNRVQLVEFARVGQVVENEATYCDRHRQREYARYA